MMKIMMRIIAYHDLFSPLPPPSLTIFGYYHFIYNFLEFKLQRNQYRRILSPPVIPILTSLQNSSM